jgi:molybdopterin molybdotransferase
MISVEDARARILAGLEPVTTETINLAAAWNRVLATPVVARLTQPPADVSAMDGYAVRATDAVAGAVLRVIGAAPAGRPFSGCVAPGEAVRLFTGSVVPQGADTIVLQEDVQRAGDQVSLREAAAPAQHIRHAGQDFAVGDLVLQPGMHLTARRIGVAAAANHPFLTVHRVPRVAILATGDELALPGDPVGPGGIVSSNSFLLAAFVQACGAAPLVLPTAGDTPEVIAAAVAGAAGADLLVTTGGASVGDHDVVQAGLARLGFELDFWKIAMRPGKPMISGRLAGMKVLGLPGNPVSAAICAVLFLGPALARLSGLTAAAPAVERALAGAPMRENDRRADHLRATLDRNPNGESVATPFPRQDSGLLTALSRADCLILRAPHAPPVAEGDPVDIIRLEGLGA